MTAIVNRIKRPTIFLAVVSLIVVLLLVAIAAVALTNVGKQQDRESLAQMKDEQVKILLDAETELPAGVDAYLSAYEESLAAGGSQKKAIQGSKKELAAFKKAEKAARSALTRLKESRGAGQGEVRESIAQFEDSYLGFVDYVSGLVDSYPLFHSLFQASDAQCQDIFVGDKGTLSERSGLLSEAADKCRKATAKLQKSKNSTYVEYAQRLDTRLSQLETDAVVTSESEKSLAEFTATKDALEKKIKRALATNASDKKLFQLADEADELNAKITAFRSDFEFSAKRYLKTVKDMPVLLGDVFSKYVPEEFKYFDSVIELRSTVLKEVLADAAVE